MTRKPGKMYRAITQHAYTRREYMGGVPASRITQFDLGGPVENFPVMVTLAAAERCQIRHTALEAGRIAANRYMTKIAGATNFHLKVRVFPHHVIRENKQATGAGADRVSQGMRQAFGKPVGTAARVEAGQKVMSIWVAKVHVAAAKDALRRASSKFPTPGRIKVEKGKELLV